MRTSTTSKAFPALYMSSITAWTTPHDDIGSTFERWNFRPDWTIMRKPKLIQPHHHYCLQGKQHPLAPAQLPASLHPQHLASHHQPYTPWSELSPSSRPPWKHENMSDHVQWKHDLCQSYSSITRCCIISPAFKVLFGSAWPGLGVLGGI